jgi:hypothetical protein
VTAEKVTAEEAGRRLRELHPLTTEQVQRLAALLLSVGTGKEVA